jgi:hypothetical protein
MFGDCGVTPPHLVTVLVKRPKQTIRLRGLTMTSWNVVLVVTLASDGSPVSGVPILEATPQFPQLAVTDAAGAATVTFEADPGQRNALYIATTRFSIQNTGQTNTVTVYDHDVYVRTVAGLSPFAEGAPVWKVQYTIADGSDGSPITGIPVRDPLTGVVLASNPNVTLTTTPDASVFAISGVSADSSSIIEFA